MSPWIPIILSIVGPLLGLAASWGTMQSRAREVDRQIGDINASRKSTGERFEKMQRESDREIADLKSEIRLLRYAMSRGRTLLGVERPPSSAANEMPELIEP